MGSFRLLEKKEERMQRQLEDTDNGENVFIWIGKN